MTKDLFWEMIDTARLKANGNLYEMHEILLDCLLQLEAKDIYRWGQYYGVYHMLSDTLSLYMAAYVTDNSGDDSFEYFRGWLISQGEKVYLSALANPDTLANLTISAGDMLSFEGMMGLGYEAYADKLNETGELPEEDTLSQSEVDAINATITFANDKGLESKEGFFAQLLKKVPKLCQKFGYEGNEQYEAGQQVDNNSSETKDNNRKQSRFEISSHEGTLYAYFDPQKDKVLPLPENANTINSIQIHQGTELVDISNLAAFTGLKRVNFDAFEESFSSIKDISILGKLTQLEDLNISNMPHLTNINFIGKLPNIQRLVISDMSELTDLSGIEKLEHLETFIIFRCPKLQDIPSLQTSADSLKTARIMDNKLLQSIECLRGTHLLEDIWISNTQVEDISPLEKNVNAKKIDLSRNKISNIEALSMLVSVESIDLSRNKISDISPLRNLQTTTALFLSGNKISDISVLSQLQEVTYTLDLSKNKELADISALKNVKIGGLDLNRTAVTDFSPVAHIWYIDVRDKG